MVLLELKKFKFWDNICVENLLHWMSLQKYVDVVEKIFKSVEENAIQLSNLNMQ